MANFNRKWDKIAVQETKNELFQKNIKYSDA